MKKYITLLLACCTVSTVFAQETNVTERMYKKAEKPPREQRDPSKRMERPERNKETMVEQHERKLQLMDRALDKIGVTEEQRAEIIKLQEQHRELMRSNMEQIKAARKKLSGLQDSGGTEAELDAAIQEVSDAQTTQLKILVRNRTQMESILGKEKFRQFMENARSQFQKHGRKGGSGMPDRPEMEGRYGKEKGRGPGSAEE